MARHGTARETAQLRREILKLKRDGHSNRLIARALGISEFTVRYHLRDSSIARARYRSLAPAAIQSLAPAADQGPAPGRYRRFPAAADLPQNVIRLEGLG